MGINTITGKIKASIVELFSREIKFVEAKDYYTNGDDNLYPYEIERVTTNSSTASRAINLGVKFISGKSFKFVNKEQYNKTLYKKIDSLITQIALNIFVQNGCFIKVFYTINDAGDIVIDHERTKVLEYVKCRVGKTDSDKNPAKIAYYDFYENEKTNIRRQKQNQIKWFFPYNPNPKVVLSQIQEEWKERYGEDAESDNSEDPETVAKMIKNFSGQVMFVNLQPQYIYPLSRFDSVYDDCDTEYRVSVYTNTNCREGFLGKTAVITAGLDEETSNKVVEDLKLWLGAENSSNLYHLDLDGVEDIEKVMKIIQVSANYDENLFALTDKRIRRNILGAANNLPEPLIYASEGSLFGTSGETYREMKNFYTEQTESERKVIEGIFDELGLLIEIEELKDVTENIDSGHG